MDMKDIMDVLNGELEDLSKKQLQEAVSVLRKERESHLDTLLETIENLASKEKKSLFDAYSSENHYDDRCYAMELIDDIMGETAFSKAIRKVDRKEFDIDDDYFWYDRFGDIVSGKLENFLEEYFYAPDIAEWYRLNDYDAKEGDEGLSDWKDYLKEIDDRIEEIEDLLEEME